MRFVALALLPMYDLPELRLATDNMWAFIAAHLRHHGIGAPETLSRPNDLAAIWADTTLLLGQTCGYPLTTSLAGKVTVLATPCYTAEGCNGPYYRSAFLVRATDPAVTLADLRGRICAVNEMSSNSGMNVLRAAIAPLAHGTRFFARVIITGAHQASMATIAGGQADIAAIDCVTWAHLQRWRPTLSGKLRVLGCSEATPGLPLITAAATPAATQHALIAALNAASADPGLAQIREALMLRGFAQLAPETYNRITDLERQAIKAGYPTLQ
jgi:ABC-type phosphate/phosphonate transport system substrate-binding protein